MKYTYVLLLLLFAYGAKAQSYVNGIISENTTWTTAESPYIVNGNLLVNSGSTLTIEPGVSVKFDRSTTLQINGGLVAIGSPSEPIVFTSNASNPRPGDWNYIHFAPGSTNASYDKEGNYISGCIVKHCEFKYGGGLNKGILYIDKTTPHLEQCTITKSSSNGIFIQQSVLKIDQCHISNNRGAGIYSPNKAYSATLEITDSNISSNTGGGIVIEAIGNEDLIVKNNTISNNTKNAILINSPGGSGSGRIILSENRVYRNNGMAISIDGGFDINMECNLLAQNYGSSHLIYMKSGYGQYFIFISKNTIKNNTTTSNRLLNIYYPISYETSFYFVNNEIIDNEVKYGGAIMYIRGALHYPETFKLVNNTLVNNKGTATLDIEKFDGWIRNNTLSNPTAYEIYNRNEAGMPDIDATDNYWNTADDNEIKIFDWFDNPTRSLVQFLPRRTSAIPTNNSCSKLVLNDMDFDGVYDQMDNCPSISNPDQNDANDNGIGDLCDDSDGDGIVDIHDNCPDTSNADQKDINRNGIGDVCDDYDGDGVLDSEDNCWYRSNPSQEDENSNGIGDVCDDSDNDGVYDNDDNCPYYWNSYQKDINANGIGDTCDDTDGDGITDSEDNCPLTPNGEQLDKDHDDIGDVCDDSDEDGIYDDIDNCPFTANAEQHDYNVDGIGDVCDDSDNDGVVDALDNCPDTSAGATINSNGCHLFQLPSNNFKINVMGASCVGAATGSIAIEVMDTSYKYLAYIEGINGYSQTLSMEKGETISVLNSLKAGVYEICFKIQDNADFEQCFELEVNEPQSLIAMESLYISDRMLDLELSGATAYNMVVNGISSKISGSSVSVALKSGLNQVEVTTDLSCQGKFSKHIFIPEEASLFPNPTIGPVEIYIEGTDDEVGISIYDVNRNIVIHKTHRLLSDRFVRMDVSRLSAGIYFVEVSGKQINHGFKLIKK